MDFGLNKFFFFFCAGEDRILCVRPRYVDEGVLWGGGGRDGGEGKEWQNKKRYSWRMCSHCFECNKSNTDEGSDLYLILWNIKDIKK